VNARVQARRKAAGRTGGRRQRKLRALRPLVFERDNWMCWICKEPCDRDAPVPEDWAATLDHLIPSSLGGRDEPENLACAHFICNSRRGNSMELPVAA
jgi:5-methylcytosine-specific restriction endonuclease McrA